MTGNKAIKVTTSIPANLTDAAKAFAAAKYSGNLSRVFQDALREHLEAHDALPNSDDAELQATLSGLAEAYTPDELRAFLNQRTAAEATTGGCYR